MIEVFNLNHYIVQASNTDPDFAVFAQSTNMYMVAGTSPDRIYTNRTYVYAVAGGGNLPRVIVPYTAVFVLRGGVPGNIGISSSLFSVYELMGGTGASGGNIAAASTTMYAITT